MLHYDYNTFEVPTDGDLHIKDGVLPKFTATSNSEGYVDLGSQLGTGWEQDREYTVKFKNGKLYLS